MTDEDKEKKEKANKSTLSFVAKGQPKERNKSQSNMALSKSGSRSNIYGKTSRSNIALGKQSRSNVGLAKSYSRMKMRKPSYGFGGVPGIKALDRSSQNASDYKRPAVTFLPTFQLDPYVKFHSENVKDTAEELLDTLFTGHKYDVTESPALALRIAADLMRKVKFMEFNRYRIISIVTLGQKRAQSYNNAVTFLWDHERDNYVDLHRENTYCFIQITLFGIYLD